MKELSKEEEELLFKDLSQRLPCKVKCNVYGRIGTLTGLNDYGAEIDYGNGEDTTCEIKYCKPYLRTMSSMTEEESAELSNIISEWSDKELFYLTEEPFLEYALQKINYSINPQLFDWLNANYFDYRTDDEGKTMIENGLALKAPKGMYNLKNK